jgi:hypothetical protein
VTPFRETAKLKKTMPYNQAWSLSLAYILPTVLSPLFIGSRGTIFPLRLFSDLFKVPAMRMPAKTPGPDNESVIAAICGI